MTTAKAFRSLVAKMVDVNPRYIYLAKEPISPNFIPNDDYGHSWAEMGSDHDEIFGINLNVPECKQLHIRKNYSYSQNGDKEERDGEELQQYLERTGESYELFLVHNWGVEINGSNRVRGQDYDTWTLYKSADFKTYFQKVELEDIERWDEWMKK